MIYLSNDLDFQYRMVYIVYWNSQRRILLTSARWHQLGPPIVMLHLKFPVILVWVRQLSFSLGNCTKGHIDWGHGQEHDRRCWRASVIKTRSSATRLAGARERPRHAHLVSQSPCSRKNTRSPTTFTTWHNLFNLNR